MKRKRGSKFLNILNSKPVIGALIFIMLSLVSVLAGNVIVKEGSMEIEDNLNSSGVLYVNSTSGYVGIGALTPATMLHVKSPSGTNATLRLENSIGHDFDIQTVDATGSVELYSTGNNADQTFYITKGGVKTTGLQIDGATASLDTEGSFIRLKGSASYGGTSILGAHYMYDSSNNRHWVIGKDTSHRLMTVYWGGSNWVTRGYQTTAGAWTDASDISYKKNIEDVTSNYGLDAVMKLNPVFYEMKDGYDSRQVGFIAQEIEKVIPEVVSGEEGSKGISYGHITAVTVKAIQEQQEEIELLKSENDLLKEDLCTLGITKWC